MAFKFGPRSLQRLKGVHPDLVRVISRALEISPIDFSVIEGVRSLETQRKYVAAGASRTMNSRHLTGHAVDLAGYVGGRTVITWNTARPIASAIKSAAKELGVKIEWGGDWRSFPDGPHFQLPWKEYPIQ